MNSIARTLLSEEFVKLSPMTFLLAKKDSLAVVVNRDVLDALVDHALTGVVVLSWKADLLPLELLVHLGRSIDLLIVRKAWVDTSIESLPNL